MKRASLILATLLVMPWTAALAEDTPGKVLAETTFKQIDANSDGAVPLDELQAFRGDVFVSMDADDSGAVSLEEFQGWDFGFVNIAEDADKEPAFRTAQRVVFDLWDRDNDQSMTADEMESAMVREMAYSDLDADGSLTVEEFIMGFGVNVAYRSALKGD